MTAQAKTAQAKQRGATPWVALGIGVCLVVAACTPGVPTPTPPVQSKPAGAAPTGGTGAATSAAKPTSASAVENPYPAPGATTPSGTPIVVTIPSYPSPSR